MTADQDSYQRMTEELNAIGYLQSSLKPLSFLKFYVYISHRPGALSDFLHYTTACKANIAFIDFDDKGRHPDRLTISLNLEDNAGADRLLDQLKSRYRIEIIEYDNSGLHLDDTVFYLRFAQNIREIIGDSEDRFLMQLLGDINHIAQELMNLGQDPKKAFESVLVTGRSLKATTGSKFYADVQIIPAGGGITVSCFQPPCGGNVFILEAAGEAVMIDTGYGIYYPEISAMIRQYAPDALKHLSRIIITHADADHCGAGSHYRVPALMHPGTLDIIRVANRAYGSRSEESILEEVYTTMINLFSGFAPSEEIQVVPTVPLSMRGIFPVVSTFTLAGVEFEILEGMGGHTHGMIFVYSPRVGLLFTSDTVINFEYLTPERATYNSLAVFLVTSVNVDSDLAKKERRALLELAEATSQEVPGSDRPCLICGGHGPVSVISGKKLVPWGEIEHYQGSDVC
ncbi:glyoxylase-like metal-dependent hydrolase (beta-lactamase superfamily II) [Methanolinea mesophila]|uniref:MBL fold metallo-hydrolase n=1 Tax=Methanolinea mesophila TaxID=547055 RepID=UPI0031598D7F|nr:glyoxylase-like metal-dependent hydrolase (beta-lactamase superfamily II) [Methanolinea mesophila]